MPEEINRLGRTLSGWRTEIANWHVARVTNAATEAANKLAKRIKRVAFGFTNFNNYRIRALLYAGKPNWTLLETHTPTQNAKRTIQKGGWSELGRAPPRSPHRGRPPSLDAPHNGVWVMLTNTHSAATVDGWCSHTFVQRRQRYTAAIVTAMESTGAVTHTTEP
ncbi:MAG: transposase, partial [Acidimicrobiia bacterium]|nr:transposase [Acidimicrobiia bacterium]